MCQSLYIIKRRRKLIEILGVFLIETSSFLLYKFSFPYLFAIYFLFNNTFLFFFFMPCVVLSINLLSSKVIALLPFFIAKISFHILI